MLFKRTKIVCTLGPASNTYEKVLALADAGMNVARLNFSHGNHEEKAELIKIIRRVGKELGKPIAILADLSGPKLRLGTIEGKLEIKKGDELKLSYTPKNNELPMQFDLVPFVKKGQRIFLNDGLVELIITNVSKSGGLISKKHSVIHTIAQNDGWISSNKGINVPDSELTGATFTPKDRKDCEFALEQEVDYIALSFIQTADDIKPARELIKKAEKKARIVVKLEKPQAIKNLEEIVKATDAAMVARGDLGIELPASEVPIIQERIITLCRQNQKPVIVATQMLESMTENPRPTRAEVSDVARAVMDQVDAVMLSAESAAGKYPVESVLIMRQTILRVESSAEFKNYIKIKWEELMPENLTYSAIMASAASLSYRLKAKIIVVATASGKTARILSSFRPDAQVIAVTHSKQTSDQMSLIWGIRSVLTDPKGDFDQFQKKALSEVKKNKLAEEGDQIIFVTGSHVGMTGSTDTIKVVTL